TLLDFIIYILSNLSFWYGFSPFSLSLEISKLFKAKKDKEKENPNSNQFSSPNVDEGVSTHPSISTETNISSNPFTMKRVGKSFFKALFMTLSTLGVTLGFCWQCSVIFDEYFKYPTTTHVSILPSLPENMPPVLIMCRLIHSEESMRMWFQPLNRIFSERNGNYTLADNTTITKTAIRIGDDDEDH